MPSATITIWAGLALAVLAQLDQTVPPPAFTPVPDQTVTPPVLNQTNVTLPTTNQTAAPIVPGPAPPTNVTLPTTNQTAAPVVPGPAPPTNVTLPTTNQTAAPVVPGPAPPTNVTLPTTNQTAAPVVPGPVPPTNVTLPTTNQTAAPVVPGPVPPTNVTAAPIVPGPVPLPLTNRTTAPPIPVTSPVVPVQNVSGNVTAVQPRPNVTAIPIRGAPRKESTAAPATVMPTPVSVSGGIITPSVARQQTTPPGRTSPGLNANDVVIISGWNGTIIDGGETLLLKLPRSQQLDLRVQNIFVPGAGSTATFRPLADGNVNFMSELLLLDDEIQLVLRYALSAGLEATALHSHFLFDQPKAYFLHLHAGGIAPAKAASALRNVTNAILGVRANPPPPSAPPIETRISSLTLQPIQAALAPSGLAATKQDDGTVLMTAPPLTCTVMGYNTSFTTGCQSLSTFAGSDGDAIVYGQFCSNEFNMQRVLINNLVQNLTVTAIVNHFVGENPEILFVHFWGRGPAQDLASKLALVATDASRTR